MNVQIFGTRFQLTLGDLRLSIGFTVDSLPASGPEVTP